MRGSFATIDAYVSKRDHVWVTFIEDCGRDNTFQLLNELVNASANKEKYSVLKNPNNLGKGGTLKHGVNACKTELLVFTDPDLAYDLTNIDLFYKNINANELLIANRVHPDSRYLIPPTFFRYIFTRHLSSRIYNKMAQLLLIPGIEDNQAGLKMFFVNDIKPLLFKSKQNDFSFDLELLVMARANNLDIKGMPVHFKYDTETTTVAFARDAFNLFGSLMKIFSLRIRGYYKIK
jgi:dolichyl-phosphate beta-glucosyltransferase